MKKLPRRALLLAALLLPAAAAQAAEPIKVGIIFPLSGGAGPNGQDVTNAIKVMAEMHQRPGRRARPPDRGDLQGRREHARRRRQPQPTS